MSSNAKIMSEQRDYGNGSSAVSMEIGHSHQDLVSGGGRRRWKVVLAAAGAAAAVVLVVVLAIVLTRGEASPAPAPAPQEAGGPSLEDILQRRFAPRSFNGSWLSGSEFLYRDADGGVVVFSTETRASQPLLTDSKLIPSDAIAFVPSADRSYVAASHTYIKVFRHTFLAHYEIINLETKSSMSLVTSDTATPDRATHQLLEWAPRGMAFAYVHRNNIFYRPSAANSSEYQLTTSGQPGVVYNGIPDWVYEEEVLSSNKALWFSPDGQYLAYATFNDSATRVMTIPYYGLPGTLLYQYPRTVPLRYPKPGTPNPTVELRVARLDTAGGITTVTLPPPEDLAGQEPILTAVTWVNDTELAAVWMNRVQNSARIITCTVAEATCSQLYSLHESDGWVDLFVPPIFSSDGQRFVIIMPWDQGNGIGRYRHIIQVNAKTFIAEPLTRGQFVVTEILQWDKSQDIIYFLATEAGDPTKLHLYSVPGSTDLAPQTPTCLSCGANSSDGQPCNYNSADFSPDGSSYVMSCLGPGVPRVAIFDKTHREVAEWESNSETRELLKEVVLPDMRTLDVQVEGGFTAKVQLWLPPGLDTSGRSKYPLLVTVYGGPDSFQVTQRFQVDWNTYLTTNKGIIYAAIDGRGSGLKGNDIMFALYRKLGSVEIRDQLNVTRHLQQTLPYVDASRSALWGWSYGGYSTAMALATDLEGVFKCGMSVAPVSDWLYYDSIYTERFMGLPTVSDNLAGYQNSSLLNKVANLRNKKFLLVHGTLDDNVHYQQSMMLARALELSDIPFSQQTYPDEDHGLAGVRPHLYHTLGAFLDECFE
ncbi:venom dipeptidyl peptidase 4 [Bacillus rossius redtenbacheri]|uniref:venom dipeptidyl peptidase 4 n=1 Tax=Bacillus rossius redtenbacheri TaxID=93214 RepID=UPI002FDCC3B1